MSSRNIKKSKTTGNPISTGWYTDTEGAVFGNEYWIYPTYSNEYKKLLFFDTFSSKYLIDWEKHVKYFRYFED